MGTLGQPRQVRLFASLIFADVTTIFPAEEGLVALLGHILERTTIVPFDETQYYAREMGPHLKRRFLLFEPFRERESLPEVKLNTNRLESRLSHKGGRSVNIDPGYISLEHIVLATTKGYSHRIYLRSGIFADLTLIYREGSFRPLQWTYPDYGSEHCISMFNAWREEYKTALRDVKDA